MLAKSNTSITVEQSTIGDIEFIDNKIVEFNACNVPFTQQDPFVSLSYVVKDDHGAVISGITAYLYCWKILNISVLWADEQYRGFGYGSMLLKKVEEEAVDKGCTLIHLETFDFQAKDFYLKHGYEVFGVLDDCPPGHKKYFMKKKLQ